MSKRAANKKQRPVTDALIDVAEEFGIKPRSGSERRTRRRYRYDDYVALLLVAPTGDRGRPQVLRAKDISFNGISVRSKNMIYPGSAGALQLLRSDGTVALVGVTVIGSRYLGNMQHLTGMLFTGLPPGVTVDEFLDRHGRLILMDPMLRQNLDEDVKRSTRRRRRAG